MLYAVSLSCAKNRLLMGNYTVAFPSVSDIRRSSIFLFIKCNSAQIDGFVYSALLNYYFYIGLYVYASLAKPL